MKMENQNSTNHRLFAFDFDHTIIEANSDIVLRDLLTPDRIADEVKQLARSPSGWTEFMSAIFVLLHEAGFSKNDILREVDGLKETLGTCNLIHNLASNPLNDIIIVSDSNSVFITQWLASKSLTNKVRSVFTNPAMFSENEILSVKPFHVGECDRCPKNLDKGSVLLDFISKQRTEGVNYKSVCYVGDGRNDLCPILKLNDGDLACARDGFTLQKLLESPESEYKHSYVIWQDGNDLRDKIRDHFKIDL